MDPCEYERRTDNSISSWVAHNDGAACYRNRLSKRFGGGRIGGRELRFLDPGPMDICEHEGGAAIGVDTGVTDNGGVPPEVATDQPKEKPSHGGHEGPCNS